MVLKDRVALITGAGRGIGRANALCFAGEGARIAVTGRDVSRLTQVVDDIQAFGGEAEALALDVTSESEAVRAVEQVIGRWDRIDLLVNNAGVITCQTPVWATTMEQWDGVMNTNLRGMHLVCRSVIPHMMQMRAGRHHQHRLVIRQAARWRLRSLRGLQMGCRRLYGLPGQLRSSLRHQGQRHQSRLGGYRYGPDFQSRRRPGLDYRGAGGASGPVPGSSRSQAYDRPVHRPLRRLIIPSF